MFIAEGDIVEMGHLASIGTQTQQDMYCLHGYATTLRDQTPYMVQEQDMHIAGVCYKVVIQLSNQHHGPPSMAISICPDGGNPCHASFTTSHRGLFGFMTSAITGESIMVTWATPRELYMLLYILRSGERIPLHLLECVGVLPSTSKSPTIMRMRSPDMELVLPPGDYDCGVRGLISYRHDCELIVPGGDEHYNISLQCKVMYGGGLVLHGVLVRSYAHNAGSEGLSEQSITCYTPRGVMREAPIIPEDGPPPIVWRGIPRVLPGCR